VEVVSVRYPSLEHHGTAAEVFGSSGQPKAERNDWPLVLRAECAACRQAVADLSKDNSSFANVSLGRIIRVVLTLASGIVALVWRRGGIGMRFLATLVVTVELRARQAKAQAASSLAVAALDCPAPMSVRALSLARLRHERIANEARSVAAYVIALGSNVKLRHRTWNARSAATTASFFIGTLVSAGRDKNVSREAKRKSVDAFLLGRNRPKHLSVETARQQGLWIYD